MITLWHDVTLHTVVKVGGDNIVAGCGPSQNNRWGCERLTTMEKPVACECYQQHLCIHTQEESDNTVAGCGPSQNNRWGCERLTTMEKPVACECYQQHLCIHTQEESAEHQTFSTPVRVCISR